MLNCYGQKEANYWYFGNHAALDFNSGAPVAVTNSAMFTGEGSASISDSAGSLLFYTKGDTVWNKNHVIMSKGIGLFGNGTSTQTLIVPQPGNDSIYYIFTADYQGNPNGFCYSIVNMNLQGGLGEVNTANIQLFTPSTEKVTAVKHRNKKDIWVIAHEWNSNTFFAFLLTSAGISAPVTSNVGTINTGAPGNGNAIGSMKISPDGCRLGLCMRDRDMFEVFNFNNFTF